MDKKWDERFEMYDAVFYRVVIAVIAASLFLFCYGVATHIITPHSVMC